MSNFYCRPGRSRRFHAIPAQGRASLWHGQGSDGCNPLPDEDTATGCHRDGAARARLQSHARHEHHGRPTGPGGDAGIVAADIRLSAVEQLPSTAAIRVSSADGRKSRQIRKNDHASPPRQVATRLCVFQSVFARPRPISDIGRVLMLQSRSSIGRSKRRGLREDSIVVTGIPLRHFVPGAQASQVGCDCRHVPVMQSWMPSGRPW